ncbi:MAG TPA: DUF1203 domain-containing protein [Acidimicrobiales bacterium]|nr:DUF1203 domain-containing protein [Acidimicrobiales bacterium]
MDFTISGVTSAVADGLRADIEAGRVPAERRVHEDRGAPCRQCLRVNEPGETMLLFTFQPFRGESPYAVPSPVFLHAEPCSTYVGRELPAFVREGGLRAIRSYDAAHAIHDGEVVPAEKVASTIERLLDDERAAYVHVHCAVNGCFTFRADRA